MLKALVSLTNRRHPLGSSVALESDKILRNVKARQLHQHIKK